MKKLVVYTIFIFGSFCFIAMYSVQIDNKKSLPKQKKLLTGREDDDLASAIKTYSVDTFKKYLKNNNIPSDAIGKESGKSVLGSVFSALRNPELNPEQSKSLLGMVEFLLDTGADVNQPENFNNSLTPLTEAVIYFSADVIKLLLAQKDIDINKRNPNLNNNNKTALHYAVLFKKPEAVKLLLQAGADQTIKDYDWISNKERTPLELAHYLLERERNASDLKKLEKIIELLKNPPLPDAEKKFKKTIFHTPKVYDIHYNYQQYFDE